MTPPMGTALMEALPRLCGGAAEPALLELIAALWGALERGQLDLSLDGPPPPEVTADLWPDQHRAALAGSPLVVAADQLESRPEAPLVLVGDRVSWRRWHQQLEGVLNDLVQRAQTPIAGPGGPSLEPASQPQPQPKAGPGAGLDRQQRRAVAAMERHGLVVLGGGPGTGKTSTVVQMVGAALARHSQLRLHLAAPTGKAANRLKAALDAGADHLADDLAQRLRLAPCTTLHRLLDSSGDRFHRHRHKPLALDLLVVDEVSMVDLPLMEALLEALPRPCQLVLVGDPAQLPPVGPGAVLLDLTSPQRRSALGPALVELQTTYRNNGAIAAVAAQLRPGGAQAPAPAELREALDGLQPDANLQWHSHGNLATLPSDAMERLRRHQHQLKSLAAALPWDQEQDLEQASKTLLEELERCILLTPVRQGRWGVEAVHRSLMEGRDGASITSWPLGTPVLCQRNLPEQELANGDIGVLVERQGERLVLFPGLRLFHPARLGNASPALALTIHKSQGSQYGEVLLLLPPSRHWDPRLLYTGLTRAQERAYLFTPGLPSWLQQGAAEAGAALPGDKN